ncbi:LytTR family DNA-binding domain-containing protein [Croceitalea sp. MTPC9]|uniref:LytR/AlgR family response regulator transcription factor n=1 Tax=unclassified Croceitalea TaxID=2632280 RepID=UPI002B3E66C3|nr:LytTR family DNA-binding domain-containing protein [Croceitalea sp. MTPC6]GMN18045.1 LytTR family DNA-binding domain-containing protein [Croceitalea sp. MTPC9]
MIKTLIVDDENHCINRLLHLIERRPNTFEVVDTCQTVEAALEVVKNKPLDLVFLDIEIKDKTGFDFLRQLEQIQFNTIFTTAFDNYAIKAFKYSAFDYLLKPIDVDEFNASIERLDKKMAKSGNDNQVKSLLENVEQKQLNLLTISSVEGFETIQITDIIHLEASGNYTYIHTRESKKTVSKPIKFYEDFLDKNEFFKCHKSHLIKLNEVKSYHKGKQGYVIMTNGNQLPVAVRRKDQFLGKFDY